MDRIKNIPKTNREKAKAFLILKRVLKREIINALLILTGIVSAAFGLKSFLLSNGFIDGGITGISLLVTAVTNIQLPLLIILLNIPFVIMGYAQIGKVFMVKTALGIIGLAVCLALISFPILTNDKLLISVFGGFFLGAGIGLTMRGGGVIDGTEVMAIYFSKKTGLTIGDIILIVNIIIFSFAAWLLSFETALYSILTYLSASRTVDFIIEGIEEYTGVTIISAKNEELRLMITEDLGRGVTIYKGARGYNYNESHQVEIDILYTVITRLEVAKLNTEIEKIDPAAFVIMNSIKDTKGGMIKKKSTSLKHRAIMWKWFSGILLRNKLSFTLGVLIVTAFMGFEASKMELSYQFAKILPDDDSTFIEYQNFKTQFGEDGNVMVMGFEDKDFFKLEKFRDWHELSKTVKNIKGIKDVMSLPTIFRLVKNDSLEKFETVPLIQNPISSQAEVDSLKTEILNLPFYEGFIYNKETGATLLLITFNKKDLDSKRRLTIVDEIKTLGDAYQAKHGMSLHYSGMPYIRTQLMTKVSHEMTLFLVLAICVTAIILWMFFRSFTIVIYSLIVVVIGVVWSIGIMELFGYKITVLSGLIAPLIMVIGLPNCIFLINKFQSEYKAHGNKMKALQRSIETIGITLFLANITTAIGFGVLYFTKSSMLVEFGVVAAVSVMATYYITLILIPVILNVLPSPKAKHTKHQEGKRINKVLQAIDSLVQKRRGAIYLTTTIITLISFWGMTFIDLNGFVVDDLPAKDPVYTDLHFFEDNFKGVLPFEIVLDTKVPNGLFAENAKALYKLQRMQKMMAGYDMFSKPFSIVEGIKFSYQAYKGGAPKFYKLPSVTDLKTLSEFTGTLKGQNSKLRNFLDTAKQITRISYQAKDIGSKKMDALMKELRPKIDSIFPPSEFKITTTGHSLVFLKSNDYLLSNLMESLLIEIILIAIVGIALFRSVRIILLSKLPCLIPLVITAGIMGFLDIRFKPSTILIFSIAFGISSDGTIYFLTKYRQELKKYKRSASDAISAAIKDTGLSMIYTSIILFCGFAIFSASSFGGTVALGVLVSLTLLISMFTNLILLPAILLSIHRKSLNKEITDEPYIDIEESVAERGKDLSDI